MPAPLNIAGQKLGRWSVISRGESKGGKTYWLCKCDCGTLKDVLGASLTKGETKSCGCYALDSVRERNVTHGKKHSRVYRIWNSMKQRCSNPKKKNFKDYGGRGITVCERWKNSFEAFLEDMGEPPDGMSIDRFPDTNGHYEPGNCRWANAFQQARNTRKSLFLTYKGVTKPLIEWAEEFGFKKTTLIARLRAGMSPEQILETPITRHKSHNKRTNQ